jgi:hypothetical protein
MTAFGHELPSAVYRRTNLVLLSLTGVWSAHGQEMFKLLGEREIRARVVGKDITDSSHWVSYLRSDGALFSRRTNSACRTRIWNRSIAMKSGCQAPTYGCGRTRMQRLSTRSSRTTELTDSGDER